MIEITLIDGLVRFSDPRADLNIALAISKPADLERLEYMLRELAGKTEDYLVLPNTPGTAEGEETVPCADCGTPTPMTGTKLCDGCWEARRRRDRDFGGETVTEDSHESFYPRKNGTVITTPGSTSVHRKDGSFVELTGHVDPRMLASLAIVIADLPTPPLWQRCRNEVRCNGGHLCRDTQCDHQ